MSLEAMLFALAHGGRAQKKAQTKKAKKSYNNWFEKLQLDELKSLCRASKLPVSGTKAALCGRLFTGELSRAYAYEYAPEKFSRSRFQYEMSFGYDSGNDAPSSALRPAQQGSKRSSGLSNEDLKTMCREKGLIVSGKRYELVLRILQNETGVGGAPKRAAGELDKEGTFQPKKRAKSMKLPDVDKISQRIFKKFFPSDKVQDKWSNNKHKYHPPDCIKFACNILDKEVFEKELFERGEETLAWELINIILYRITNGNVERRREWAEQERGKSGMFMMIGGTDFHLGRCSWELQSDLLPKLVKAMKSTTSKSVLEEVSGDILWDFQNSKLDEYSQFDEVNIGDERGSFKEFLNEFVPRKADTQSDNSLC